MANFCSACRAQLNGTEVFCWKCGAQVTPSPATPSAPQPQPPVFQAPAPQPPVAQPPAQQYQQVPIATPQPPYQQTPQQYTPTPAPAPAAKSSSPVLMIVLIVLGVLFVGGLVAVGGVIYMAHRVSQKVHQLAAEVPGGIPGESSSSSSASSGSTQTSLCGLLSAQQVSQAIGVEIVATAPADQGCQYLAKGTAADFTAKHMAAIMGARGADQKTQQAIQQFAGGVFNAQPKTSDQTGTDRNGNTPVFVFTVDTNSAQEQMKLNAKVMAMLGPSQVKLEGIGDEAYDESNAMMLVRKGNKLIRITYSTCPCTTEAIKPLAQKLANSV